MDVWGKSILGRGKSQGKGSELGLCLAYSGNSERPVWMEQGE